MTEVRRKSPTHGFLRRLYKGNKQYNDINTNITIYSKSLHIEKHR